MSCLRFMFSITLLGYYFILKVNGQLEWLVTPASSYENAVNKNITLSATFGETTIIDPSWSYITSSTQITVANVNVIFDTVYCQPDTCSIDTTNGKYDLTINSLQRIHDGTWRIDKVDADPTFYDTVVSVYVNVENVYLEYPTGEPNQDNIRNTYIIECLTYNADPAPTLIWSIDGVLIDDILADGQPEPVHFFNSDATYDSISTLEVTPTDSEFDPYKEQFTLTCKAEQPLLTEGRNASVIFYINGSVSGSCSVIGVIVCIMVCSAVAVSW